MPNATTHFVLGGATAAVVNVTMQLSRMPLESQAEFNWKEFLLCSTVGGFAGLLPDIIEPANTPNHRGFFHSIVAAALIAYLITGKHTGKLSPRAMALLSAAGFAYLSHLLSDAMTPKSIRFI